METATCISSSFSSSPQPYSIMALKQPLIRCCAKPSLSTDAVLPTTSEKSTSLTGAVLAAITGKPMTEESTLIHSEAEVFSVPRKKIMVEPLRQGRLVEGGIVYRQTFVVPSYAVGADKTVSIETFLNQFQETALNHVWMSGLLGDGFGATHAMICNSLIWVISRMQVEVESYPAWGDVVELDTWVAASGKNGMRRDWLVRNYKTGEILARATSTWVMMHQKTRRLSKMPDEVKAEIVPWFINRNAIKRMPTKKITKLADNNAHYICSDLKARRSDLDMNQHVNNVKYVGWMLQTIPESVLDKKELESIIIEYRRECSQTDVVQSLSSLQTDANNISDEAPMVVQLSLSLGSNTIRSMEPSPKLHYIHLLQLQGDGAEILRGETRWRDKKHAAEK